MVETNNSSTGEWIRGYIIGAKTKQGKILYWMIQEGYTLEESAIGLGLVVLKESKFTVEQQKMFQVRARSFVTGEVVEGYPFYIKTETEESSYWLVKNGITIDGLLTDGLVNVVPETIVSL